MRVIWWLGSVFLVSIISIVLSHHGALDPVRNVSLRASAPVEGGLRDIASPISDFVDGVTDHGDVVRENEQLRQENERLQKLIAEHDDALARIKQLEDALDVKASHPEDQFLTVNVIAQDPSGLKRAIAIDRGQSDGIDEGMVVLSRNGTLVGTVSASYKNYAWVRLVTDPDSTVNAQVDTAGAATSSGDASGSAQVLTETPAPTTAAQATPAPSVSQGAGTPVLPASTGPIRGVATGDLRDGIVLDLLPSDARVTAGSQVITSGLGGNYPRSLLIGSVTSVDERPQSPFKKATIEPAADLSRLDTVLVLISFKPERLAGP